jgi:hypothetical protein
VGHTSIQDAYIYPFRRFGHRVTLPGRGAVSAAMAITARPPFENNTRKEASDRVTSGVSHTIHAQVENRGRSEGGSDRRLRHRLWGWKGLAPDRSGECAPTSLAPRRAGTDRGPPALPALRRRRHLGTDAG